MAGIKESAKALVEEITGKEKIPNDIDARLKRGRERLAQVAPRRREAIEFANGNHYVSIDKTGRGLTEQSTVSRAQGGEKPDHRVRRSRDLIGPILKGKVSAATQRVPGYEVVPSTTDPEDYSATRLGKKILVAGYDLWRLKSIFRKWAWFAFVTEEGFAAPFWESNIGPFVETEGEEGTEVVGLGDVRGAVYSGLEVIWEPGVEYEDSRWIAIEHARPKEQVEAEPDYIGGDLKADADEHGMISGRKRTDGNNLVVVTEYLERPCPKYPKGRRCWFANGKKILPDENYPKKNFKGEVVDEPYLHRVVYSIDGSSDRHRGLVQSMIESMRQYDYGANKAAEYLQLVLVPQIIAPVGAIKSVINDEPGAVVEVDEDAFAEGEVKWREMPQMPREFHEIQDRARAELGFVSHENEIPSGAEITGKGVEALGTKDRVAWQDFIEDFATAVGGFGRDCLCLVQQHYTEDRLMLFRGRTGWEAIADFRGADIRGQTDVRVTPGSMEARTRAEVEQQIMQLAGPAGLFPNRFPPEVVMRAISMGDLDILNEAYEEDEARVNFIISQIRAGTFWDLQERPVVPGEEVPEVDESGEVVWIVKPERDEQGQPVPGTGQPQMAEVVEGWMPRPFDNIAVHKLRIETFMKSDEWNHLSDDPEEARLAQQASMAYYRALLDQEVRNADRARELQNERAEELGMQNAARPQGAKPLPDQASPESGGGGEQGGAGPAE